MNKSDLTHYILVTVNIAGGRRGLSEWIASRKESTEVGLSGEIMVFCHSFMVVWVVLLVKSGRRGFNESPIHQPKIRDLSISDIL